MNMQRKCCNEDLPMNLLSFSLRLKEKQQPFNFATGREPPSQLVSQIRLRKTFQRHQTRDVSLCISRSSDDNSVWLFTVNWVQVFTLMVLGETKAEAENH